VSGRVIAHQLSLLGDPPAPCLAPTELALNARECTLRFAPEITQPLPHHGARTGPLGGREEQRCAGAYGQCHKSETEEAALGLLIVGRLEIEVFDVGAHASPRLNVSRRTHSLKYNGARRRAGSTVTSELDGPCRQSTRRRGITKVK
jgi:hypothetical protein